MLAKVNHIFSSSNNHLDGGEQSNQARGSLFDIQSDEINSHSINVSEGCLHRNGAIEFRYCTKGSIKFQAFQQLDCSFIETFVEIGSDVEITECVTIKNTMRSYINDDNELVLVYTVQCSIVACNYYATGNYLNNQPRLAKNLKLNNWHVWKFDNNKGGDFDGTDVRYYESHEEGYVMSVLHLGLGRCKGNITVGLLVITPFFTNSQYFTSSLAFSNSDKSSKTDVFSKSYFFTYTDEFTKTGQFSNSKFFFRINSIFKIK